MNSDEDCPVTPPKKYKRGSKVFVDDWLTSGEFKGWLEKVQDDVTKAKYLIKLRQERPTKACCWEKAQ
ncbi:hypothetical protein ACI65C_013489 [Semiaphis heraclei]